MTKAKDCKEQQEFVAPDGGWGWIVVIGTGISTMAVISVLQTFGLLYKERFEELHFSVTDTTSLMSVNSSFGMILGIFYGPLLKRFGYRKVALVGGVLFVTGFFYLAFAETYAQYLMSYGMIASMGASMSFSSFSLALNTYFKLKRSKACSFSITLTGLGPIVLPLLITELSRSYGWKWCTLIIAAMTMNHFVGTLLLQPVEWHLKPQVVEDGDPSTNDSTPERNLRRQTADNISLFSCSTSLIEPAEILGRSHSELSTGWSQNSLHRKPPNYLEISRSRINQGNGRISRKLKSVTSLDNEDYGDMMKSTLNVLENSMSKDKPVKYASVETLNQRSPASSPYESQKLLSRSIDIKYMIPDVTINKVDDEKNEGEAPDGKRSGICHKIFESVKKMYDLDLLLDPIYINLLIGLSIATVGELMFSLLTPFILTELGLNMRETATFMSVTAITDVIFRFLAPFFAQFGNFSSRFMYLMSICELLITRGVLLLCENLTGFIAIAVLLGIGKGFRTVYWILVVPDYVPLSKLPSAGAFQSLFNGICLFLSGPLIGAIVASNGNKYVNVVYAANFLSFTTIMMWGIEFIIVYYRNKNVRTQVT